MGRGSAPPPMTSRVAHDVLIAGAGPAGSHLALRLARAGWSVGLVDRATFPRGKPCGEFLSPECLPLLEEVGLADGVRAAGARPVRGLRLCGFGRSARGSYGPVGGREAPGRGLGIRRETLDALAFERAASRPEVRAYAGWSVRGVARHADGRARGLLLRDPEGGALELRGRVVVGADGTRSRVARELGWHRPQGPGRVALVARLRDVSPLEEGEVHFVEGGYFAACSVDGDLFTLNLVVDAARLPRGAARLEAFLAEEAARAPSLARRLAGARLAGPVRAHGPLGARAARCTGPGAALVGDAAGFVDPLTGEGLFFAMRGAALLADALDETLREPHREARAWRRYERRRRAEIAPRHALARLLQRGVARPRVVAGALALLASRPGLAELVVALTGDYVPPADLLRPSVWRAALARGPSGP